MGRIELKHKLSTPLLRAVKPLLRAGPVAQGGGGSGSEPEVANEEARALMPIENIITASFGCNSSSRF